MSDRFLGSYCRLATFGGVEYDAEEMEWLAMGGEAVATRTNYFESSCRDLASFVPRTHFRLPSISNSDCEEQIREEEESKCV